MSPQEWSAGDGPIPLLVYDYPWTKSANALEIKFVPGGPERLQELLGQDIWLQFVKGIETHPLLAHISGERVTAAAGFGTTAELLRAIGHATGAPLPDVARLAMQRACLRQAFTTIAKPIEARYPAANGIDQ